MMEPWFAVTLVLAALVVLLALLKVEQTNALKDDNYMEAGR